MKILRALLAIWKKFAETLGWINTRILLSVTFFVLISPLALIYRLCGKIFLELKIDKAAATYWEERSGKEFKKDSYLHPY